MHLVYSDVKVRDQAGQISRSPASGWLYDLRALNRARVTMILGPEPGRTSAQLDDRERGQPPGRTPRCLGAQKEVLRTAPDGVASGKGDRLRVTATE
jgi:hypothetical protein